MASQLTTAQRVIVVGAHGKVARLALPLLVRAGHAVVGIVRDPGQADDVRASGAGVVVADVENLTTDELIPLFIGQDVLVWSAGAGGGSPQRTYAVDRDAAMRSMDAAAQAGVARFVMVSYFGAGPRHGVSPDNPFFAYAEAKSAADAHLQESGLAWTILRPSALTDAPASGLIGADDASGSQVSRADVAQVIVAVVDSPQTTSARIISFNDGPNPIGEVIARDAH